MSEWTTAELRQRIERWQWVIANPHSSEYVKAYARQMLCEDRRALVQMRALQAVS